MSPVIISSERKKFLNGNLMLFFTGFARFSGKIAAAQEKSISEKLTELNEMKKLVDEAQQILVSKSDLNEFGRLLDYTWKLKRGITSIISNDSIDEMYSRAIKAGALGGKLLGAGGGGFILLYVEKDKQEAVKKALGNLLYIPFEFENDGTKIIYYQSEDFNPDEAND